jgi:hypothetical protein
MTLTKPITHVIFYVMTLTVLHAPYLLINALNAPQATLFFHLNAKLFVVILLKSRNNSAMMETQLMVMGVPPPVEFKFNSVSYATKALPIPTEQIAFSWEPLTLSL